MVTHVLIRLADLREEAAHEEYVKSHPCSAYAQVRVKRLKVRAKLLLLRFAASRSAAALLRWYIYYRLKAGH